MDCGAILTVPLNVGPDACAAAVATIRAAQIQADAARYAGDRSFLGGTLTLCGGVLAVLVTLIAVRIQTNAERRSVRAREHAFSRYLKLRLRRIERELDMFSVPDFMISEILQYKSIDMMLPHVTEFAEDFAPTKWESLIVAGDLVPMIDETYDKIVLANEFIFRLFDEVHYASKKPKPQTDFSKEREQVIEEVRFALESIRQLRYELNRRTPSFRREPQGLVKRGRDLLVWIKFLPKPL